MASDEIHFSVTTLRIRTNSNRAGLDSIYKEIKKHLDFEDVTKEFLDDRIHLLINNGKIINKLRKNADYYCVNLELADLETPDLFTVCAKDLTNPYRFFFKLH